MNSIHHESTSADLAFLQSQLSAFSASSVVAMALRVVGETRARTLQDLQAFPWLTLLMVKWVLQDPRCPLFRGESMSRSVFDGFRQRLWNMTGPAKQGPENVYAMMRSILPAQIEFQRRAPWAFLRWPSLVARLPLDHPSRLQFEKVLALSPEDFVDACWIITPPIVEGKRKVSAQWVSAVPEGKRSAVLRLLHALGGDLLDLRQRMSVNASAYRPSTWELFEVPFARRFPFFRTANNSWVVWHPAMFERAVEDAAHLQLTPLGSDYTQSFSEVFENYVVELAREMSPGLIDEQQWWSKMGHNAPAVEAILPYDEVNVFVEAKMSLFHDAVLIEDIPAKLQSRLERVTGAIHQGQKVSRLLRERPRSFPRRAAANEEYLIVVTSREVHIGGALALERLLPDIKLREDADLETRMPLENIFVMSIETYERLRGVVTTGPVQLVALLRQAAAANRDARTSAVYFEDHLKQHHKGSWPVPPLFRNQRDAAQRRIETAFSVASTPE